MAEGKRKPGEDADDLDDAEAMAAASLLGDDACAAQKGKKTKFADKVLSSSLAQTIADADALTRLVNRNLRKPEDAASASTGPQSG